MKIYIKNMVCLRCKMAAESVIAQLNLPYTSVELGEAEIPEDLSQEKIQQLREGLEAHGLELMDDKKSILVEKIKITIIELVHYRDEPIKVNLSDYLAEKLDHNYTYIANLFAEVKGTTIEKYYLQHRVERVKELLIYDELTLTEIAYKMHYSSVAHLSTQFKKMIGLTPSQFKMLKAKRRKALENI